ncbi:MAG: S8 family serine peptidase [Clostridia bacterium]|nr:S8 family serine peptidase [Clostridia bacterium]
MKFLLKRIIAGAILLSTIINSIPFSYAINNLGGDLIESDDIVTMPDFDDSNYSDSEVLIMLEENEFTSTTQFYSIYSEDYLQINEQYNSVLNNNNENSLKISESTNSIDSLLNLGIEFTEMKLLNPSQQSSRNNLYKIEEKHNNIFSITLDGTSVEDALKILNDNPNIKIAEPNYYSDYFDDVNSESFEEKVERMFTQEAYRCINMLDALNVITGNGEVVVGIIDSGIDGGHQYLEDNLWVNPYNPNGTGCSACGLLDDIHGYNFTEAGSTTGRPYGGIPKAITDHGTHVAGIVNTVCGNFRTTNTWNVSLAWLGVSVGNGLTSYQAAIEAINYAQLHGIPIINCSTGGKNYSSIYEQAILNYDGLFITAAGNKKESETEQSRNNDIFPIYPASYDCPNIISVAATTIENEIADKSHYGSESVHVAAPGDNIFSTFPNNTYGDNSGTSMASPIVAGIAALVLVNNPTFTPLQIKAAICGTVQPTGKTYNIIYDGGIVDAEAAVSVTASSIKNVTFDYNYTNAPDDFIDCVLSGKCVFEPELDPIRNGYTFNGWYTSPSGGSLYDFDTPVTSNITLYAQWVVVTPNTYAAKFPDYRFRDRVLSELNGNHVTRTADSVITTEDYNKMAAKSELDVSVDRETEFDVPREKIRDLTGIEYFTGLTELYCQYNRIKSLDVSKLKNLETLDCSQNFISSLNLSGLTKLKTLNCSSNLLTSGNFSAYTSLTYLNCSYNNLSSIIVYTLTNLKELYCSYNNLSSLSISSLRNLTHLDCSHNNISSLGTANLSSLKHLYCSFNNLTTLQTGSSLIYLDCGNNQLTKLFINSSTQLSSLYAKANRLRVINGSNLTNLLNIDLRFNEMNEESDFIGMNRWNIPSAEVCAFSPQNVWNEEFADVNDTQYYYKALQYVSDRGIMTPRTTSIFGATATLTRSELALIVYRMAGSPSVTGLSNPFTDVSSSSNYINAVKWVYNNGTSSIMNGTSSTAFNPNGTVTREMLAVVLDRYATRANITFDQLRTYQAFADDSSISSWAKDSVINMYRAYIINGGDNNIFDPTSTIQRKDTAVILRRFEVIYMYL